MIARGWGNLGNKMIQIDEVTTWKLPLLGDINYGLLVAAGCARLLCEWVIVHFRTAGDEM